VLWRNNGIRNTAVRGNAGSAGQGRIPILGSRAIGKDINGGYQEGYADFQ